MALAFKRVYVDVTPETHARLQEKARERNMSQKAFLESLINEACEDNSGSNAKGNRKGNR